MAPTSKKTKRYMVSLFVFLTVTFFVLTIGALFVTAYGSAWSPWSTSFPEMLWSVRGFLITTLLSLITVIGLVQSKKYGIVCGLSTCAIITISILISFFFGLNGPINNVILSVFIILLCTSALAFWKMFQTEEIKHLTIYDHLFIDLVTIATVISLRTFFFE